ncbi:MAG: hypothetical protein ACC655_04910 [Rhodothermia bacterium]
MNRTVAFTVCVVLATAVLAYATKSKNQPPEDEEKPLYPARATDCRVGLDFDKSDSPEFPETGRTDELLLYPPPPTDVTIHLANMGVPCEFTLDNAIAYRVELPGTPMTSSLRIIGGKDVVIIGGAFDMRDTTTSAALTFYNNDNPVAQTIHVEGVDIEMGAFGKDAIAFDTPGSHLQLQNIRITGVDGAFAGGHADALQNWGGALSLSVHKMTVRTNYQGFWIGEADSTLEGFIGKVHLKEVEFARETDGIDENRPIYLLLTRNLEDRGCVTYPGGATLEQVYIIPDGGAFGDKETYPNTEEPDACKAQLDTSGTYLTWPDVPGDVGINGAVEKISSPRNIVPEGYAGVGYTSPGYILNPIESN